MITLLLTAFLVVHAHVQPFKLVRACAPKPALELAALTEAAFGRSAR